MHARIEITRDWEDEEMFSLDVAICDGRSLFATHFYCPRRRFGAIVDTLRNFREGSCQLQFDDFPEDIEGACLRASLHAQRLGTILIAVRAQTFPFEFNGSEVANSATLHLATEPALLDDFVRGLDAIAEGFASSATLIAYGAEAR